MSDLKEQTTAEMWGESEAFLEAKNRMSRAARINRPILITGERGTGKELAAARLHYLSPRWEGPYLALNCAALNPNLLESELFGYEPGAFTGATRINPGRFEAANKGTLFLDEISHLSLTAQAKILRVVEYGSFSRLGSTKELKIDVRLVSASNVDLQTRTTEGTFLPDLLDRLSFEIITLPPLRERKGDITHLAHRFAARMAKEMGLDTAPTFTQEALEILGKYTWPGNIRELKNVVERTVYHQNSNTIEPEDLGLDLYTKSQQPEAIINTAVEKNIDLNWPFAPGEFDHKVAVTALKLFNQALTKTQYNQKEAAHLLGLTYHRFRFLYRKYLNYIEK